MGDMRRRAGYVAAWLVTAAVAIAVGVFAVSTVGASIEGRGPLGNEVVREPNVEQRPLEADPDAPLRTDAVTGDFGSFEVGCRGVVAYGLEVRPNRRDGWDIVSYESGPDDDVDAVFGNRGRSVDIEVFCNQGMPTVGDLERNTLPDDD